MKTDLLSLYELYMSLFLLEIGETGSKDLEVRTGGRGHITVHSLHFSKYFIYLFIYFYSIGYNGGYFLNCAIILSRIFH